MAKDRLRGFNFSVRAKYAGLQAAQITSDGTNLIMAVRTLNQHGAPPPPVQT